jgi:hypothetical protein
MLKKLLLASLFFLSACGTLALLLGTEKPVDQKSKSYRVEDISQSNKDWFKLDSSKQGDSEKTAEAPDFRSTSVSDVAYLSHKDASVISLNSSCDPNVKPATLRQLSDEFFNGMTQVSLRQELPTVVQGIPALQTTVHGRLYGEPKNPLVLRTVVLRHGSCQFAFIYLALPQVFSQNEEIFSSFVHSFRLRPG